MEKKKLRFYKIGFYTLLIIVILGGWVFVRANPMKNEGALSWSEFYSAAPEETLSFLNNTLGIQYEKFGETTPMGLDYFSMRARRQFWPFAGVIGLFTLPDGTQIKPHTIAYLTVKDYDATREKFLAGGAVEILGNQMAAGMKFGIYTIPGGIEIGIAQYGVRK
ncbi:MAG: hypothetical protein FWG18_00835 [Alphaproteobacteria bacterium]|nr:hypothetical protein [Alphaproteobacteria bacterium]